MSATNTDLLICPAIFQNVLVDKMGNPLSNGKVYFYQDADRATLKNVFQQTGDYPNYTYPVLGNTITLSAAGTTVDVNGNDLLVFFYPYVENTSQIIPQPYFIQVYDQFGTLQFTRSNFPFLTEGEEPPPIDQTFTNQNLIVNNRFWRHVDNLTLTNATNYPVWTYQYGSNVNVYYQTLAPDQHDGFSMPDFNYVKFSTAASETITFNTFAATAPSSTLTGDIQPEYYITHLCTGDTGNYYKAYQFPISLHLATLANQNATFTIQTMGAGTLTINLYSFSGSSNSSGTSITTPIGSVVMNTSGWTKTVIPFTFLTNLGIPANTTNDDAFYLQISFPSGQINFNFTLPSIYLSPKINIPNNSFSSYDKIDSVALTARTGDVRTSINAFYPYGWLPMNDGLIALTNPGSNTQYVRANADAWPLYNLLWNFGKTYDSGSTFNPLFQMYSNSAGTLSLANYGGSAIADWTASKALALPFSMGQVFMGTVPLAALIPAGSSASGSIIGDIASVTASSSGGGSPTIVFTVAPTFLLNIFTGNTVVFSNFSAPIAGVVANTVYYLIYLTASTFSVATTFANAVAKTAITYSSGTGNTVTVSLSVSGSTEGEYAHTQLLNELAAHTHSITTTGVGSIANSVTTGASAPNQTGSTGSSTPFNVTQPSTFMNIFIKL